MRKTKQYEIDAEAIVYNPAEIKLRTVIFQIIFTLFSILCAYALTDYSVVVSHDKLDYIFSVLWSIIALFGIYTSVNYTIK